MIDKILFEERNANQKLHQKKQRQPNYKWANDLINSSKKENVSQCCNDL